MSTHARTFVVDLRRPSKARRSRTATKPKRTRRGRPMPAVNRGRKYALRVEGERIRSRKRLREVFLRERGARRPSLFVSFSATQLASLADVAHQEAGNLRLFVWEKLSPARREYLQTLFRTVVSPGHELELLDAGELAEVLSSERRADLFVGGAVNRDEEVVVLYRGSFDRLAVRLGWFRRSSDAEPDFDDFAVIDFGQTIRFGDFEASADAILYQFDADYRSRMKRRQIELDDSLGGSLRRLRELKGMKRSDFSPVSSKQIARIERGEVANPRASTLETIAKRLGATPDEIRTY